MATSSTYEELCAAGEVYAQNRVYLIVTATKCLIAMAGSLSFSLVYYHQRLTSIFHPNARLILKFHIAFIVCSIVGTLSGDGYTVVHFTVLRYFNRYNSCAVTPISPYFTLTRMLKLLGFDGTTFTATAWCLERIYATVFIASYEQKKTGLGWLLCIVAAAATIGTTTVRVALGDYSNPTPVVMVTGTSYRFNMTVQDICAFLVFFNVFTFSVLFVLNRCRLKRTSRIECSLTSKYQIRENVRVTSLIFPLALLHWIAYFPIAILMPIITKQGFSPIERVVIFTNTDWMIVYCIALPLLLWWQNGVKRNAVATLVRNNLIGAQYASERKEGKVETAKYFEMFNRMLA